MATRVAVVTGGNRGIGRAVADGLAARGMHVVVTARRAEGAEAVAAELRAGGATATGLGVDVTDDGDVQALVAWLRAGPGRWDVLVNNAGILPDAGGRLADLDPADARAAFETNVLGAWRMAMAALPMMRAGGWGRIVNVSSGMGGITEMGGGYPAYRWSKAGLNALTRMLAAEVGKGSVLVNSVCPGWVQTEMGGPGATRTPAEGAASVLWAVDLAEDGPTGGFFRDGRPLLF